MENKNALAALAYLRENLDNPYSAFCMYIKYCASKSASKTLTYPEIKALVYEEFGLALVQAVFRKCAAILCNEGFLGFAEDNGSYVRLVHDFDLSKFDETRQSYQKKEQNVIDAYIAYARDREIILDEASARSELVNFLKLKGNAYTIFVNGSLASDASGAEAPPEAISEHGAEGDGDGEAERFMSEDWCVGGFLSSVLETPSLLKSYLSDVIGGLMLCIGVYQLVDVDGKQQPGIKDTHFYFDTKLILRILGCAWESAVASARELAELITSNGGRLYVFDHTLQEVESALRGALIGVRKEETLRDKEMQYYVGALGADAFALEAKLNSFRTELVQTHGFGTNTRSDSTLPENHRYYLDESRLKQHIKKHCPKWGATIPNDITSVNEINVLRQGNYSCYYGGKARLPIFVTHNTDLVWVVSKYREERSSFDRATENWGARMSPLIGDGFLTCRLWLPQASSKKDIPLTILASYATAAKQPNAKYYETIRQGMLQIEQAVPQYNDVNLSELSADYADRMLDTLVRSTGGDISKLTPDRIAMSLDELVQMGSQSALQENEGLREEVALRDRKLAEKDEHIVASFVRNHRPGIRIRLAIHSAEKWWLICPVLAAIVAWVIPQKIAAGLLGLGITAFIVLISEWLKGTRAIKWLSGKLIPPAWERFAKSAEFAMSGPEKELAFDILSRYLSTEKQFERNRAYCKYMPPEREPAGAMPVLSSAHESER